MRLRDLPIEQKLFLLILPICLIPAMVFVALAVIGSRIAHEETMGGALSENSAQVAAMFDQHLRRQLVLLDLSSRRLTDPAFPVERRARTLEELTTAGVFDYALFMLGDNVTSLPLQTDGKLVRALPPDSLLRSFVWPSLDQLPEGGALFDTQISVGGRLQPLHAAILVVPLRPAGGVAVYVATVEKLIQNFRQSVSLLVSPDFLVVRSSNGYIVYSSKPLSDEAANRIQTLPGDSRGSDKYHKFNVEGRPYLIAAEESALLKRKASEFEQTAVWSFFSTYDLERYLASQDRLIWLSAMVALPLVLALLILASILARQIVRPLHQLREQADMVAGGHLQVRAPIHARDEIGQLAETFNSMALQLRQNYRELQRRAEENHLRAEHINAINEIFHASIQAQDIDTIFDNLGRDLRRIFHFDALWMARFDLDARAMRVMHVNPPGLITLLEDGRIPLAGSLHGRVVEQGETLHAEIGPSQRQDFFETMTFGAEGFQSYLIAPLPGRHGMIGALGIASIQPDAFNQELAGVMTSVAVAVALAAEQAELFRRISQFADELERKVRERTLELEQARTKLSQAEKYFALGRLAANLAHEINNPLAIIKNYLQLTANHLAEAGGGRRATDPNLNHLRIVDEEVDRIARLVQKLMDLHRPTEANVQPVDINRAIRDIVSLMEEDLRRNRIDVTLRLEPDLERPWASQDLIRQVLINLIRNAQDAMEKGGTLTIETSLATLDGGLASGVRVRITDTGVGIALEHMPQIFDPFFTTKPEGKGTGLGLCVSYSIVHIYSGTIDIESRRGHGTTVTIFLPLGYRRATRVVPLIPEQSSA